MSSQLYPNTRRSVLPDIQTLRSTSNTRRCVSSGIQTKGVFYLISNISNSKRTVSSDIQAPRSDNLNTRGSNSSDIQ